MENSLYFPRCKCCLEDGSLKSLWADYNVDGEQENYGEMLTECFSLSWKQPFESEVETELICDSCIQRLRDAYSFKKEVLASEQVLADAGYFGITKEEQQDSDDFVKLENDDGEYGNVMENYSINDEVLDEGDYQEIEYLEEEYHMEEEKTQEEAKKKSKKGRKRNYSEANLKKSIEAVVSKKMTKAEAARVFNVPKTLLQSKILSRREYLESEKRSKHLKFIEETKTILNYTNATPYKTKICRLYCFYCPERIIFDNPNELRSHTRTEHAVERTIIDKILKLQTFNEIVKLDIDNFSCTQCDKPLITWNNMFQHLKDKHNLEFDEAYNRVIPFLLGEQFGCGLCPQVFTNHSQLDEHMNFHYNSYICNECGEPFLTEARLKKHLGIHKVGRYPCDQCGKIFTLQKYRNKHIRNVHEESTLMGCVHCPLKFKGEYTRHLHVLKCHKEKVKLLSCEFCGKTFDFRPYYVRHLRRKHSNNNKCVFCKKMFDSKVQLRHHEAAHRGQKIYSCKLCDKNYTSPITLNKHYVKVHGRKIPENAGIVARYRLENV